MEVFQNRCVKPCDVWSFGIVMWEIGSLGSTPYFDVRNEDLMKRVCRGARPNQLEVMGDSIYQIMLNCWQVDRDERPSFPTLCCSIHELLPSAQVRIIVHCCAGMRICLCFSGFDHKSCFCILTGSFDDIFFTQLSSIYSSI